MQLPVLRRFVVSARARGMPEMKSDGKLFFRQKSLATGRLPRSRVSTQTGMTRPPRFNRPENNRAQIPAVERTSGRDQSIRGLDGVGRIPLRLARRLQCARTADAGSTAHRM